MTLSKAQQAWVNRKLAEVNEDEVYASIGANDFEAFNGYMLLERQRITDIAIEFKEEIDRNYLLEN